MHENQATSVLRVYNACSQPLYSVLIDIPQDQLNWKPAPESRSIAEMMRHLIRVDNWFLNRLGIEAQGNDPGKEASVEEIRKALTIVHQQIRSILENCRTDADLSRRSQAPDAREYETLAGIIVHISQHYLYHLAQMVYLRRARDRQWNPPLSQWENATHVISGELAAIQRMNQ